MPTASASPTRGLSFKTTMGSTITLTPPLVTTVGEMDAALDILEACLAEEQLNQPGGRA